ncbi:hypothetical protein CRYUN_Cryun01aG0010000 [Craigia yunnanensis]
MASSFMFWQFLFFLILFNVFAPIPSETSIPSETPLGSETGTLLRWKASLDNKSQSFLSSWVGDSPCSIWVGIACDEGGSITSLSLRNSGLRGTLYSLNFFSLPNLMWLTLHNNSFYGGLPSQIGNLSKLTFLDLSYNNFFGNIPSEISLLKSLDWISLNRNHFSGHIPQEIGRLSSVSRIYFLMG